MHLIEILQLLKKKKLINLKRAINVLAHTINNRKR